MDTLQFAHPYWLVVGLISCFLIAWLQKSLHQKRQEQLARFASAHLLGQLTRNISTSRRRLKNILQLLGIMLLFTALAQPQYGFTWTEVKRKGIDILFALDTSKSMLAEDTRPNRLQRAKLGIMDFVSKLDGDRVGLLPFAGTSYLMCPLTLDYDAFTNSLTTVTTDIIPKGGTNISAVIQEAETVLNNDANHKILILLTDGENLEGDVLESGRAAREKGMSIYTVGVGTASGELIPLGGNGGFVKDQTGQYVTSRLDEETLTALAEATGGLYAPLGNSGQGLQTIYQQKLTLIPKEELMERRQKIPIERFLWPLTAALIILLIEYLLPEQKLGSKLNWRKPPSASKRINAALVLLLLSLASMVPRDVHASSADDAYAAGNYLQAAEIYQEMLNESPEDPQLNYNYGTTAYKNNLHDEAIAAFSKALKSDDLNLQAKAYYNRGNALYQKGVESQQADPKKTIEKWQEALTNYDGTLQLSPDDKQAQDNRTFVEHELQKLQEQMNQQQEQQNQNNDQQQEQQDNENQEEQKEQQDQQQDENSDGQNQQESDRADSQGGEDESQPEQAEESQEQSASETGEGEEEQPQPAQQNNQEQEQQGAAGDQDVSEEDKQRRAMGQMTREEAENLLDALKNEEGELNFVPQGQDSSVGRDW